MAGTPKPTLEPGYTQGRLCPVCGQAGLQVRHMERYPDFVTCTNCESAFVVEEDGERVMYGKLPVNYPDTRQFALNEWAWPEAIERRAQAERPPAAGPAATPSAAPATPPEPEPTTFPPPAELEPAIPPERETPPAVETQTSEPVGVPPEAPPTSEAPEPAQSVTPIPADEALPASSGPFSGPEPAEIPPFEEPEHPSEIDEFQAPQEEIDAAQAPLGHTGEPGTLSEPDAFQPPQEEAGVPTGVFDDLDDHTGADDADDLLSALWATDERAASPPAESEEQPAPEPASPGTPPLPDDWIPMDDLEDAPSPGADPFDQDVPIEPKEDEEYPEWLSLADEIDEMVSPFEVDQEADQAEPEGEQPPETQSAFQTDQESVTEDQLAQAYWAGPEGAAEPEAETPAQRLDEVAAAAVAAVDHGSAAPSPSFEPEPGKRHRVVLKGVQIRFPRRHCSHCFRSPAMKYISVLANLQRSMSPQREMTTLRIPVCDSCHARANAVSEEAQTARFQAHMLGALVALTLVVCSLVFRITDFQNGVLADIVALIVIAGLGYGIPMVVMMLRASQFPKPADSQFVETTLRVPGDTEGMETAFEWRSRMYAKEFLEANQPIAVSEVIKVEDREMIQPE